MSGKLEDKGVVVTGGTSGIGRGIAQACAAEGARVVLAGRNQERGDEVKAEIEADGGECHFVATDITRVEDCRSLIAEAVGALGRVDVLVNAAGVFEPTYVPDVDESHFDETVAINVKGTYFTGQAALEHMRDAGGGRVINMSSIAGLVGFAGSSVYCATKGAILALTKAWAIEYAPAGINVNCIAPGNVDSPMNAHLMADTDYKQAAIEKTPSGRNGQISDIAPAVVLLAGSDGGYMQGTCIVIDGGWVAQ
jgi:NAD(P)-dependent dehydrogenase (short-subunit alcohol dehydrogenase family)